MGSSTADANKVNCAVGSLPMVKVKLNGLPSIKHPKAEMERVFGMAGRQGR